MAPDNYLTWNVESPSIQAIRQLTFAIARYDKGEDASFGEPLYPLVDPRHAEFTRYALYFRGELIGTFKRQKEAKAHAEELITERVGATTWNKWKADR